MRVPQLQRMLPNDTLVCVVIFKGMRVHVLMRVVFPGAQVLIQISCPPEYHLVLDIT